MTPPKRDASTVHLEARLALLESRVREAVERRRAGESRDERFRGLYITDADVDDLLDRPQSPIPAPARERVKALARLEARTAELGEPSRLQSLAQSFELDDEDVELLVIALAPDVDPRFERLYGYLHDDVTRRRATPGLALELCAGWTGANPERRRFGPAGRLITGGLIEIQEPDRPFLGRALHVPERVVAHLLGDNAPDPSVASVMTGWVAADFEGLDALAKAVASGARLLYVRDRPGAAGRSFAAAAFSGLLGPPLVLDLSLLPRGSEEEVRAVISNSIREARLFGTGIVAGPVDVLAERGPSSLRELALARCPVALVGTRGWDSAWSADVPLLAEAPAVAGALRLEIARSVLEDEDAGDDVGRDISTSQFRLSPEQIVRAVQAGRRTAAAAGRAISSEDVLSGAVAQNAAGLERLAQRRVPAVGWDDLVLPSSVLEQLHEVVARARWRERVLDDWGLGRGATHGRGIAALFAGGSGTGKTMSAEVVAGSLGLDLYVIDLSTVVDKYIGETEKNLDRVFDEAERVNGVLLFDEADALFGKRSDVQDARDRYANVEVAYLLQRMEQFDGVAILTTNLRSNLDESFTRRLVAVVDFPMPEEEDRRRIWQGNLPPSVPQTDDIDLDFMARRFRVAGGNIRNICLAAAFFAAADDRPLRMSDLIQGTEREYRKLGHLCVESEFGPYFDLIRRAR